MLLICGCCDLWFLLIFRMATYLKCSNHDPYFADCLECMVYIRATQYMVLTRTSAFVSQDMHSELFFCSLLDDNPAVSSNLRGIRLGDSCCIHTPKQARITKVNRQGRWTHGKDKKNSRDLEKTAVTGCSRDRKFQFLFRNQQPCWKLYVSNYVWVHVCHML